MAVGASRPRAVNMALEFSRSFCFRVFWAALEVPLCSSIWFDVAGVADGEDGGYAGDAGDDGDVW